MTAAMRATGMDINRDIQSLGPFKNRPETGHIDKFTLGQPVHNGAVEA